MKEHITIPRKDPSKDLYAALQDAALKHVQRYSGELWTDFNEHDPGVTVMDAVNYTLLETDYRLQFDIQDYLAPAKEDWLPPANALFSPLSMYPVNPVTEVDYRKLFVSSVDDLKNVWVVLDVAQGLYNFILDTYHDTLPHRQREIQDEVRELYHTNRNLCEDLGGIQFLTYEPIVLHADIELDEEIPVDRMMARIYLETQEFLNAGIRFKRVEELLSSGKTPDEILDGPLQKRMIIDNETITERKTEFDLLVLHGRLKDLPGIVRVNSLAFEWKDKMFTDSISEEHPLQSFAVFFTPTESEQTVVLRKRGKDVPANPERVNRILSNMRMELYGHQNLNTDKRILGNQLQSAHWDIYTHSPIWNDLPACYRKAENLREYLEVFDQFMTGALSELKELPIWMRADTKHLSGKKELWMDMLDLLYGVDSNPEYLKKSEATQENRIRRAVFLNMVPRWAYERGRGRDLRDFSPDSISGVEKYMHGMFNLDKYGLGVTLIEHRLFCLKEKKNDPASPDYTGYLNYPVDTNDEDDWNDEQRSTGILYDPERLKEDAFVVSVILSANDNYLTNSEFRHCCEEILRSRMPAHIHLLIYWQDKVKLRLFEADYDFWKYALSVPGKTGLTELTGKLKRRLTDDNYWYCKV